MNLELSGKVAIVGGASAGIGFEIARTLAAEGTSVAMTARREPALLAAAERIVAETRARVLPIAADVRLAEDCHRVAERVKTELGGIDILVNNDGAPPLGPLLSFDDAAWQKAIEQNLLSVVRMVREVAPSMKERGGGSIVNITGTSALEPLAGFGLSVATWGGVFGYAKTLSVEVAADRINVNTIAPGYIDTSRLQKVFASGTEPAEVMKARLRDQIPQQRIGKPADIANLVALPVSPMGSYITGSIIHVDGGLVRSIHG
jgi:3-oxoacyl-[acyl-carrier protein] reductase